MGAWGVDGVAGVVVGVEGASGLGDLVRLSSANVGFGLSEIMPLEGGESCSLPSPTACPLLVA